MEIWRLNGEGRAKENPPGPVNVPKKFREMQRITGTFYVNSIIIALKWKGAYMIPTTSWDVKCTRNMISSSAWFDIAAKSSSLQITFTAFKFCSPCQFCLEILNHFTNKVHLWCPGFQKFTSHLSEKCKKKGKRY